MNKKKQSLVIPPFDSPKGKALVLQQLALETPLRLNNLSNNNEKRYVQNIHKVLVKYWHRRISKEEAQAWQRFLSYNMLGAPAIKTIIDQTKEEQN